MAEIILSIVIILGLAGGPSDFGDGCSTTDDSQAVSQSVNQ